VEDVKRVALLGCDLRQADVDAKLGESSCDSVNQARRIFGLNLDYRADSRGLRVKSHNRFREYTLAQSLRTASNAGSEAFHRGGNIVSALDCRFQVLLNLRPKLGAERVPAVNLANLEGIYHHSV